MQLLRHAVVDEVDKIGAAELQNLDLVSELTKRSHEDESVSVSEICIFLMFPVYS